MPSRPGQTEESCGSFAKRWPDDYRRGRKGRLRSDSTTENNRKRVRLSHKSGRRSARLFRRD
jgi:hypothetical protein